MIVEDCTKLTNFAGMFVEVIVPVPVGSTFTYRIDDARAQQLSVGMRVIVPFTSRYYTAIVVALNAPKPTQFEPKEVLQVLDTTPTLRHPQLKLWDWISAYYLCSIGDVMRVALPAGLKIESETSLEVNPDIDPEMVVDALTERQLHVWQLLSTKGKMTPQKIAKETGLKNLTAITNSMVEQGLLIVSEKLAERFKPKTIEYVVPAIPRNDGAALEAAYAALSRSQRQLKVFMTLLEMSGFMHTTQPLAEVTRQALIDRAAEPSSTVRDLAKKGLVEIERRRVSRFSYSGKASGVLPKLSEAQDKALDGVHRAFLDKNVVLLHGVTSSGKTEIYMHLIDHVLSQGNQVLFLVPEIALTTQLTRRLQAVFGDKVLIYHSRFSDNERVEVWQRLLAGNGPCVVIGARSSVFLPFAKLGLVIVDEEHESSYKQYDPAPRYNARDVATVLASMHGAKTLLGSATPAIETYYKAQNGKYGLVTLTERYAGAQLPDIEVVNMLDARRRGEVSGLMALRTKKCIDEALESGNQAIIFHNRRGYAPVARCSKCGYVPKCDNCDVSLTYHRDVDRLVCHYCGAVKQLPGVCPQCAEPAIDVVGYGTERVEDDMAKLFADRKMLRMDLDSTRNKDDYANIIDAFSQHKADILVGTQMVTKGLDFGDVSTVCVLNADAVINYPDFRSAERAFNMLEQVSGRAGRRNMRGRVIIQTTDPRSPIIDFVSRHDYLGFYNHELDERLRYAYPPFSRIIYIYIKHRDRRQVYDIARGYGDALRKLLGNRVFGPEEPQIARIQNLYIQKIMLKIESTASMTRIKEVLYDVYVKMSNSMNCKGMTIYYDVDPQ